MSHMKRGVGGQHLSAGTKSRVACLKRQSGNRRIAAAAQTGAAERHIELTRSDLAGAVGVAGKLQ